MLFRKLFLLTALGSGHNVENIYQQRKNKKKKGIIGNCQEVSEGKAKQKDEHRKNLIYLNI